MMIQDISISNIFQIICSKKYRLKSHPRSPLMHPVVCKAWVEWGRLKSIMLQNVSQFVLERLETFKFIFDSFDTKEKPMYTCSDSQTLCLAFLRTSRHVPLSPRADLPRPDSLGSCGQGRPGPLP